MKKENKNDKLMTFGGHLEVLRQMLFRIIGITTILMVVIFYFKAETWNILLWPTNSDFILYQVLQHWIDEAGINMTVNNFHVDMISTDLSSQFMTHVSTSLYIALVLASPYIVFEIYSFIACSL